jgi:hypothetical protein
MNLHNYFNHQKSYHLSADKKAELFQRINQKRLQQSVMRQYLFSYKKISYACIALVLLLMTFGGVMMERNINIDNLFFTSTKGTTSSVYAGYIAEIIEFNGEYTIQNQDKTLSSQYIHNGDTIYLKSGSEMIFTLNDQSQAKITGPAEFSISKSKQNNYKIMLTQGNFFKIFNETTNNDIEIISDDISIQTNKNQTLDLQIAKEGKEVMIKNNGGSTKVTTQKNNTKVEKTLTKEIVSIHNSDINIITDTQTFTNFLSRNNISETLSLSRPSQVIAMETSVTQEISLTTTLSSGTIDPLLQLSGDTLDISRRMLPTTTGDQPPLEEINEEIKADLGLENEKQIPSPDQNTILKNNLNSFFLMNNFEKMMKATLENKADKKAEAIADLATKVNTLAKAFGYAEQSLTDLSSIKSFTLTLQSLLTDTYYIAPSYLSQLEKIVNWCEYLLNLPHT